jgi:hypothetical protein
MENKKVNKMIKVSKKTSKFSLLEDNNAPTTGLTHKGKNIHELKEFNDMNFEEDYDNE